MCTDLILGVSLHMGVDSAPGDEGLVADHAVELPDPGVPLHVDLEVAGPLEAGGAQGTPVGSLQRLFAAGLVHRLEPVSSQMELLSYGSYRNAAFISVLPWQGLDDHPI